MLANNNSSGNIGVHYSLQEHQHQSIPHHSPQKFTTGSSQVISNGNMPMTTSERVTSSSLSYFLPAVQPRTTSYPVSSHDNRNSTSSSIIHPTIANLVTPTRASTSPIDKALSSPASFYKTYTPIVANYMSTTPEREIPKHETPQRHQYLNYRYDDTIEEISDESESMMDHCEPQRGWSTSSSRLTNSPSPVMAPADLHRLSLHDQPHGAQESSHRHHSQYQLHRAQPPLRRHHYNGQLKEHEHSILLPPTNIPEQDSSMEEESKEPDFETYTSQQTPSKPIIATTTTGTMPSSTTTVISKSNSMQPSKEKRKPKPVRAATMPMRPSHYDQMSDAQKRLYDHHPRSPEHEDDSEEDEEDEDSSEPASPRSFSSMSRSPSPSRRMVAQPDGRSSRDELGSSPTQRCHTSDISSFFSQCQTQYPSYGLSRYQTSPHISRNHHHQQHPYHLPDSFQSKRSFGSPQFPHQEKSFLDSRPRLYSRPQPQQQQHQFPMRKHRRQHRPLQLLQQSLHAAGSLDGYPYATAPLTGSSIGSTGSSSCSSVPALSPTDSFFLPSTMSPPGQQQGNNIPKLPGTEGMTVVRNEDGSIMVYNPATDAMTFRCELCPLESFGRIHDLKRHQTSKHQEMTWPCDFCHRPFVRRDALLRHYTVKAARDDGIHPASHEVEKLLEARARAKMLY